MTTLPVALLPVLNRAAQEHRSLISTRKENDEVATEQLCQPGNFEFFSAAQPTGHGER
jgi:hypothetical protein